MTRTVQILGCFIAGVSLLIFVGTFPISYFYVAAVFGRTVPKAVAYVSAGLLLIALLGCFWSFINMRVGSAFMVMAGVLGSPLDGFSVLAIGFLLFGLLGVGLTVPASTPGGPFTATDATTAGSTHADRSPPAS
jgi:hypothetical protein